RRGTPPGRASACGTGRRPACGRYGRRRPPPGSRAWRTPACPRPTAAAPARRVHRAVPGTADSALPGSPDRRGKPGGSGGTLSQACSMSLIGLIGPISLIGGQSPFYRPTLFSGLCIFSESSRTCPKAIGSLMATTELAALAGSSPILFVSLCGGPGPAPSTGEELMILLYTLALLLLGAAKLFVGWRAAWIARKYARVAGSGDRLTRD